MPLPGPYPSPFPPLTSPSPFSSSTRSRRPWRPTPRYEERTQRSCLPWGGGGASTLSLRRAFAFTLSCATLVLALCCPPPEKLSGFQAVFAAWAH